MVDHGRFFEHILTKRELDICEFISKGYSNSQIARHFYISEGRVKTCVSSIIEKTGTSNRAELAAKYIVEYEQAVTDIIDRPPEDEELLTGFPARPIARFRLLRNNSLPIIIPLVFKKQSFTIGRFDPIIGHKQCDFEFERSTKAVSRHHSAIERLSSGFAIIDLNSRYGTYINGERIPSDRQFLIKSGDKVSFGIAGADYVFEI